MGVFVCTVCTGSSANLGAITVQAASKAWPMTFKVSGPNDAPSSCLERRTSRSAPGPCFAYSPCCRPFALRRGGRNCLVRPLPRYFGQVRLLHHTHGRLRPPAFPTTSRPRAAGTAMEISRFPRKRLLRYRHTPWPSVGRKTSAPPNLSYAAQYLACALPCDASRLPRQPAHYSGPVWFATPSP
jgi:hypothetical protein